MNKNLLNKYAQMSVQIGANVQKGQYVRISCPVECYELGREIVKECYKCGAAAVNVIYSDAYNVRERYMNCSDEELSTVNNYVIEEFKYLIEKKVVNINIVSPNPSILADVDVEKMQIASVASNKALKFYSDYRRKNECQWTIVSYPSISWAEKVFPDLKGEQAQASLLQQILSICYCQENDDTVTLWKNHMNKIAQRNELLNKAKFKKLHFKNALGTDLWVELVDNHIWAGGSDTSSLGVVFSPNLPTEESFTMPDKYGVNGKVVASKVLNHQGKLIEDFYIEFKDGKVVNFDAKKNRDVLEKLINTDEGSCYLGEVALVDDNSKISKSNILFYNTLFDENAACHLALGRCYTMNIENGEKMSEKELEEHHCNQSMVHVDFMFGTNDMEIIGYTDDNSAVQVFDKGNFVM